MNSRNFPTLIAALAAAALPALGQDERPPTPAPPAPPAPPENAQRSPEADRPPGRGGPRDGRFENRRDGREGPRDDQRGFGEGRRPEDGPRKDGDRGGDRGPGPGRDRDRSWSVPLPPPAPPVATPYIGVVTMPPPAVLSAQLGLKEGFGLVVGEVIPDSPAAKAGVQKYDVLTKFNDQQLVDASQFSTLVRGAGKDSEATLTLLREAKEQKVPVKVGERMAPQRMPLPGGMPFPGSPEFRNQMERWKAPGQDGLRRMQERMRDYNEKMRDYQDRLKGWQKNPSSEMPQLPPPPAFEPENASSHFDPADILVQAQPGGTRQVRLFQPNGAVSFYTADAKMFLKDDSGEIEVSTKEGKRTLVAKNAKGAVVFDGPIDTEEQRKALPEDVRKKIEMIHVRAASTAVEAPVLPPQPAGDGIQ